MSDIPTEGRWSLEELERIGSADEIRIAPIGRDGQPREPVTIWVVRHGDDLYARSYRGPDAAWYRASRASQEGRVEVGGVESAVAFADVGHEVDAEIDAAYREKYGRFGALVDQMVSPETQATTIRLVPRKR